VSCAVHAKGKSTLEVATEIARAASARLPDEPADLAPALRDALADRRGHRFNVIIDALDEATSPAQARAVIDHLVLPLAETCSDVGAQVVVGTRSSDAGGELLSRFGTALVSINLDATDYFAEEDLAAYALACLQLDGDERPDNPYSDTVIARPRAIRIAELSDRNFLIAGLIARSHGLHDSHAADPQDLRFTATVDSALAAYLEPLSRLKGLSATQVLTALAFAETPGMPAELWRQVIHCLYGTDISTSDLSQFALSSAASFLVETGDAYEARVFRLFHQALNESLLRARARIAVRADDERAITAELMTLGRKREWNGVPAYLYRSLPGHAHAAGMIDELLTDDAYLLHADMRRLMAAADQAISPAGRSRARILHLTPRAISAGPGERAALFSVTEALEGLGASYCAGRWAGPYHARWATAAHRVERAILEGHASSVYAVCTVILPGAASLLASASHDRTVRLWDPGTGEQRAVLQGHAGPVTTVCQVTLPGGSTLLASGSNDRTVRLWDPETGQQRAILRGHTGDVRAMCPIALSDRVTLLASGGRDGAVRLWDPETGQQRSVLKGHKGWVSAMCTVTLPGGTTLLAAGGSDQTVRLWDPATGEQQAILEGHSAWVRALCAVTVPGGTILLASGSDDRTVRLWDPRIGQKRGVLRNREEVRAVCPVTLPRGTTLVATGGRDGTVRLWDPAG
jgi:hypothetical protein